MSRSVSDTAPKPAVGSRQARCLAPSADIETATRPATFRMDQMSAFRYRLQHPMCCAWQHREFTSKRAILWFRSFVCRAVKARIEITGAVEDRVISLRCRVSAGVPNPLRSRNERSEQKDDHSDRNVSVNLNLATHRTALHHEKN